jgi:hypothetical protein
MKDYKWDKIFKPLIIKYRPKTFCEIGCHEGLTLKSLTPLTKDLGYKIDYIGYDAFEMADRPTFEYPKTPVSFFKSLSGSLFIEILRLVFWDLCTV